MIGVAVCNTTHVLCTAFCAVLAVQSHLNRSSCHCQSPAALPSPHSPHQPRPAAAAAAVPHALHHHINSKCAQPGSQALQQLHWPPASIAMLRFLESMASARLHAYTRKYPLLPNDLYQAWCNCHRIPAPNAFSCLLLASVSLPRPFSLVTMTSGGLATADIAQRASRRGLALPAAPRSRCMGRNASH